MKLKKYICTENEDVKCAKNKDVEPDFNIKNSA